MILRCGSAKINSKIMTMEKFGESPFNPSIGDGGSPQDREPRFSDEGRIPRPQNDIMSPELAKRKADVIEADRERARKIEGRLQAEKKSTENQLLTRQEHEKKLNDRFTEIINKQKLSGYPVNETDGRIDIDAFEGAPNFDKSVIERDRDTIDRLNHNFKKDGQKSEGIGEGAEKLVSILFSKLLPDCNIFRTSQIDDQKGSSDRIDSMLFVDGQVVCALDVAANFSGEARIGNKENKVSEQNESGGVGAKYCFEKRGNEIIYNPEINVPVFSVKIDPELFNGIKFTSESKFEQPEMELMCKVLVSIYDQIETLEQMLEKGRIQFDSEIDEKNIFVERLRIFKEKLLKKISKDRAQKYLDEQEK